MAMSTCRARSGGLVVDAAYWRIVEATLVYCGAELPV